MNLSLKSLTLAIAASVAAAAFAQEADIPGGPGAVPAAAVEKTKEVVAAVKEVAADAEAAANAEVAAAPEAAAAPEVAAADAVEVEAKAEVAAAPEAAADAAVGGADVPDTDEELDGVTVTSGEDPDKITVSLDAVELEDVVRLFTRLSGANIICNTTNLHGTVTANLANIGWKPALKAILRQQGLALMEDPLNPDVYEIGVPPPAGKEPFVSKTFKLNYLKASEAATILRNFLGLDVNAGNKTTGVKKAVQKDKDGKVIEEVEAIANEQKGYVVAHPAANTVIVSCRGEEKMREVEKVIADLDIIRQQVYIEAKIVQVQGNAAKRVGIDWSFLNGYTISASPFARQYGRSREIVTESIHGRNHSTDITSTDSQKRSRNTSATSTRTDDNPFSRTSQSNSGVEFASETTGIVGDKSNDDYTRTRKSTLTDVMTSIFEASAMEVVMSALQTSDDAAQISNPRLIVANEERAVIDMTRKEPYVKVERTQEGTGADAQITYSTTMDTIPGANNDKEGAAYIEGAFFSYGINVDVTPRINNASNITVVIEPTLSDLAEYYTPGDGLTRFPVINSKSVRTTFSLGNGQTAVIGGLTTTVDKEVVKKVPILGSIPLLSYLFSHTEKVKEQVETIIFVTVGIVQPENKDVEADMMAYPDGARLVQKRIDEDGKIIDKRFKDLETAEQTREADRKEAEKILEADIKEAEAKGLVVPEVVEE